MEKQLLIDTITFEPQKQSLNEALSGKGPFIVKGILQRCEAKNQNGRIYPKSMLMKEAEKYNQTFIKERRALGELDHPQCHRITAQSLTKDGWKYIKDIKVGELVATLNTADNAIEYQPVEHVTNEPYKGKMISIKGRNIDILVTPNHRFILNDRKGNFLIKTAQEIFDISKVSKFPHLSIPTVADNWVGKHYDTYTIPALDASEIPSKNSEYIAKHTSDLVLDVKAWFSFLGFYLAEGSSSNRELDDSRGYGVSVCQNEGEIADKFREVLKQLGGGLKWNENIKDGFVIFTTHDARLHKYLSKLGNKYTKYVPDDIKDASAELLQNLFDWYLNGDGTCVGEYERESIFSVSKQMMEDFYEVALKLGVSAVIREQGTKEDYMYAGHLIEAKNKSMLYRLWIKQTRAIHLDFRFIKIEEVDYDDNVYCLTVKNGIFYCQDQNLPFWSGNSEIINLKNVSHNILELHWEDNDLMGTLEVLSTPSGNILRELFRSNIRVGISSRGLGTIKKVNENTDIVQDDYNLIAFDCVSTPSTQGAFLFSDNNNSLNEGVILNPITNKWTATENIIKDIFSEIV